jgi:hypothetical protein
MQRYIRHAAAGFALAAGIAGCSKFLDNPVAVADPNAPTAASVNQLLSGIEANVFGQQEGPVAMLICEWMQQCAGTAGRFVQIQGAYGITNNSFDVSFSSTYTAGGLLAVRDAEARADAIPDKHYKGVLEVLETMTVLFGADNWGSIPYREAAISTTPIFDPQLQIYDDLLKLLDQAITDLNGSGSGPLANDLVYDGDKTKWTQAAHTLKARIYLHLAEVRAGQYPLARTEALLGISAPANDWSTVHSEATSERNMWLQFQLTSFGQDLVAGARLVSIMLAQGDPRLPDYFGSNSSAPGGFAGFDVATNQNVPATADASTIAGSTRNAPTFGQPIITYDETQLILAETAFRAGDIASAAIALNNVRSRHGKSLIAAPTLTDIMTEKYIALFQNIEYFNDYKRTCLPILAPAQGRVVVPGRLPYGITELQTNPNAPADPGPTLITGRNENDPNAC